MAFPFGRVTDTSQAGSGSRSLDDFTKNFVIVLALVLGLLGLNSAPALMGHSWNRLRLEKVLQQMQNGDLNREDYDALAAGYYEGLRKDVSPAGMPIEREDIRFRDDFLRYDLKPNVRRQYPAGMRITNSLGMPNPEYGYEKPPHTWRIALLGDSLSMGPYGHDYEALLEARLNQSNLTPEIRRFEILNFSVYGYDILQMMDVALEIAPKFHPDVYLVALTHRQTGGTKASTAIHIARLEVEGIDLKYDFLRHVAAQAGLEPTDRLRRMISKLTPFHTQVTRWALEQMRNHAASEGAQMVIVLVPAPIPAEITASAFDDIRPTIDSLGIPVIDLRDTFRSKNLQNLQVEYSVDVHPNALGHEMIFENLYQQIQQNPRFSASLLGTFRDRKVSAATAP